MSRFFEALYSGRVLLMDGAMGTELQSAGLPEGQCFEAWNVTHPDDVRMIHQRYVDAGAEVILTNTFQANRATLTKHGLEMPLEEIQEAALHLAREAAGARRFVLVSIGPMQGDGEPDTEMLESSIPDLGNVDALLLETWSDPLALSLVQQARIVSWCQEVPILLSITYEKSEKGEIQSHSRHPPEWFAMLARQFGVDALGVNCGRDIGMDEVIEIVRRYRKVTDLPLFARPNAGTPTRVGDRWVYPLTPRKLAERLPELLVAGVSMVGGCCGTTPEHIAALRPMIDDWNRTTARLP